MAEDAECYKPYKYFQFRILSAIFIFEIQGNHWAVWIKPETTPFLKQRRIHGGKGEISPQIQKKK